MRYACFELPVMILAIIDKEFDDVKDKFNDRIPWLEKLLEDLAKADPDDDREEVKRRLLQLAGFVSCLTSLAHTNQTPYRSLEGVGTLSLNTRNNCAERK